MTDLENIQSIYFVGIGGIAMSAAAGLAKAAGFTVCGSDSHEAYAPAKDVLAKYHIEYFLGYDAQHVKDKPADLYVISAGESEQNPEVAYLVERGTPYISFAELLYLLAKDQIRIVVTGTHGKSTTSAMLGYALSKLDDSSFMTGAVLTQTESNYHAGTGHYFVFEGDEYKSLFDDPQPKFHHYKPDILVLTNLEYDHPDVYANLDELVQEFDHLIANLPDDGIIIYNADDINLQQLLYHTNRRTFGFSIEQPSDVHLEGASYEAGKTRFRILSKINKDDVRTEEYTIRLPGHINILNTLAVITTLRALGFQAETVANQLEQFTGIKRRFQILGEEKGVLMVDDYAHHPTAVEQTIQAAKESYPDRRIWAVFEPHTFSRTQALLPEFRTSFTQADQVLLAPIYAARERANNFGITSEQLLEMVQQEQPQARLVKDKSEALEILQKETTSGDIVIVMAVGSFNRLGYELLEKLSK